MIDTKKFALLTGIALGAVATPAIAQDTATSQIASRGVEETSPGDIIVTASRRAERLQDVPIAVSAITGDQLSESGFQKLTDIQYQFSGVQFGTSPNDSGFRLRGVGSAGGFSSSSEQNVGTVVDNVVIPFGNPINSLGDLERVEVLKGPQGTQFGKNASSGVINITTKRPDPSLFSGKAFVSYAQLNEVNANASVNVPVSSTSALGVFGFYRRNDGFIDNVYRNETWGARRASAHAPSSCWKAATTSRSTSSATIRRSRARGQASSGRSTGCPTRSPTIRWCRPASAISPRSA